MSALKLSHSQIKQSICKHQPDSTLACVPRESPQLHCPPEQGMLSPPDFSGRAPQQGSQSPSLNTVQEGASFLPKNELSLLQLSVPRRPCRKAVLCKQIF